MTNLKKIVLLCLIFNICPFFIPVSIAQNLPLGEKVFEQCKACHSISSNTNDVGPGLGGIFNRKIGSIADYRYSKALRSANGSWNKETLNKFIENPQAAFPGNRMPYSGLNNQEERLALIDYLITLKP
jgi:cytochrome c